MEGRRPHQGHHTQMGSDWATQTQVTSAGPGGAGGAEEAALLSGGVPSPFCSLAST